MVEGQSCLTNNNGFSRLFFPENLAREFDPFVFPAEKASGTMRIVVLGESAAQGTPDGSYSFSRILSRMLEAAYPDLRFEVINTGMTAINSHAILPIAEALSRYRPDAVVVYMGNNEVVGPYGAGTVFSKWTPHRGLIRAGLALRRYRLGQWLSGILSRPDPKTLRGWGGMEMFVDHQVSADDPRLEGVYGHFSANLEEICKVSERAGAQVLLCTVGSNLRDCPPFASGHKTGLSETQLAEWKRQFEQGVRLEQKNQLAEATETYQAAWKIDAGHAETAFRLGRCAERQQDVVAAGEWYRRARQLDTLRFRADDRINEIIRQRAAGGTNRLRVDTVAILEQASPNGLTGREMFYEHVHLTFSGNVVVARAIFDSLGKRLPGLKDRRTGPILTEAQCAESLAFTPYDQYRIADEILNQNLVKPPFTAQAYHAEQIAELNKQFEAMKTAKTAESLAACSAAYQRAIEAHPVDGFLNWKYGRLLAEEMADYAAAERQYEIVQSRFPLFHRALTARGQMLSQLGRNDEAIRQFVRAIELQPYNCDPHYQLARVFHKQGQVFEAIAEYRRTLRYWPGFAPVYNPLAELLQKRGRIEEAIAVCVEGTSTHPQDAILFCNLGVLYDKAGRPQEAALAFQRAIELAPNSADIRRVAETVMRRRGGPLPR